MPHSRGALKLGSSAQSQRVDFGALWSTWARAHFLLPLLWPSRTSDGGSDLLNRRLILILLFTAKSLHCRYVSFEIVLVCVVPNLYREAWRPRGSVLSFLTGQCDRQSFFCTPISTGPVMAPKPTGDRKRDKFLNLLPLRGSTGKPTSSKLQKVYTKGESFKKDMAILSIAYTLQGSSELKRLIQLIVVIRDNDSKGQVMSAMYTAYRSLTVLSFSLPKFSKHALGSVFNLHLLPMPSVQKPHWR